MTPYGRATFFKARALAAIPLIMPLFIFLVLLGNIPGWYRTFGRVDWSLIQSDLLASVSIALYIAALSAVTALPFVTIIASLSNRWFRRGRILVHSIASVPPFLLLPLAVVLIDQIGLGSFGVTICLLLIVNGSWFAHYSLHRMAVSRQITWQTLQGLGATRWQTIWHVYLRQVLHHTLDLVPFMTSRVFGQVLIIGIFAPEWQFPPAQLWRGWTSAASPAPVGAAALEIMILLLASVLGNYLAKNLSTRHWERLANPSHFPMIWSEHNE